MRQTPTKGETVTATVDPGIGRHGRRVGPILRKTCCAATLKIVSRNFQWHHKLQYLRQDSRYEEKMITTFRALEYRVDRVILAEGNEKVMGPSGLLTTVPCGNPTHAGQHTSML
jgi:hypothetical protein